MNYQGHPEREFEHVRKLVVEVRRLRQESGVRKEVEIKLLHAGECPLTDAGRQLLKKLANATVKAMGGGMHGAKNIRIDN